MSIDECKRALMTMESNKTPGTDGLTSEFYRYFWNAVSKFMVESFNHALQHGSLSISQRQGIISLIPKKNKNAEYLTNWRPVSLLNVDYKIATNTIALRLEKILPSIIHPCQSGYVKGRFIEESIRLIADTMDFTKIKNIPGIGGFHVTSSPPCWWTKTLDLSLASFVRPPAFVRFTIVICVSRDWLKTTYSCFLRFRKSF